jgi:hypothetical protein
MSSKSPKHCSKDVSRTPYSVLKELGIRWFRSHVESAGTLGIGDEPLGLDLELHLIWETVRRISLRTPEVLID